MTMVRSAFVAALLLGLGGIGHGSETSRPGAAAGAGAAVQLSRATSDREDDAPGLVRDPASACSVAPRFSTEATLHGPPSGDPEKNSVGYGIAGYTDCAGVSAPR